VAYRFFATEKRKFIVADTPGHEQYTRNMVTGASTADLAVILIDARKGVLVQTRRHSYLCHLIGIRNIVLAVNKMDLVNYDQARFEEIVAEYRRFADSLGIAAFTAIPISGFKGDNITQPSSNTPWYTGPALMEHLESVPVDQDRLAEGPLRMAVQWVNRPNLDFRGFSGFVNGGRVKVGDAVRVLPSGRTSTVSRIVTLERDHRRRTGGSGRPVRGDPGLDGRRADAAGPPLPGQAGHQHRAGDDHRREVRGERQHDGAPGGQEAGPERHRRVQPGV
jgi:bifunctional enzyme CysN/CysC